MKRNLGIVYVLLIVIVSAGCSARAAPDWKRHSFNYLARSKHYYLTGDRHKADRYFEKSVEEIRKSGNLTVLSRAYLTRCSLEVAVLIPFSCYDFDRIDKIEPDPVHRTFYLFLSGALDTLDADMLPRRYARVASAVRSGSPAEVNVALHKIDDPLSRVIAAGVAVSLDMFDESTLHIALDTASEQGWKLAVLRYLEKLKYLYEQDGNTSRAAYINEKIKCVTTTK
jgi:hypothetical protein